MSNKIVLMVRAWGINSDSRLEKEAKTLAINGYNVYVLGWDREDNLSKYEKNKLYTISRIGLKAPIGKKIVLYLPIWWIHEFFWLMAHRADVLHVSDFDTYFPALLVSKIRRIPIIYDIYDFYADETPLPKIIRFILKTIDIFFMNFSNKIIIVDHCRYNQINKLPSDTKISVVYNAPPDILKAVCQESSYNENKIFKIIYAGVITPGRDLITMMRVVNSLSDVSLCIAGFGDKNMLKMIMKEADKSPNIRYLGQIPYSDVLKYSQESDLLFAFYDQSVINNRFASPNKLFEAMMLGKPIIVNEGTAATDKVREENCGLVVPYGDVDALREAVLKLKNNPLLCKELGENGRRAYDTKYSWTIMEKRLLDLYKSLESEQYK